MILIDTDVIVDILQRDGPAVAWLDSLGTAVVGIPGLVATELPQDCRDREEKREVEALLSPYVMRWRSGADCTGACSSHHLGHGLGILDALIAETAAGCQAGLATFNERQYKVVEPLHLIQPYPRV